VLGGTITLSDSATSERITTALKTNLGITDAEARILLPVLAGGNMTIGAIALLSGDKPQTIEKALEGLKSKALVSRIDGVVPVYRALPPYLMMGADLSGVASQMRSLTEVSKSRLDTSDEELAKAVQSIISAERSISAELSGALDEYESTVIEDEQTTASGVIESASDLLTGFCQDAESALREHAASLGESLISQLASVQGDLDKIQSDCQNDFKVLNKEFDQAARSEQDTTSQVIADFNKRTKAIVQKLKSTTKVTLTKNLETLRQAIDGLSGEIESASSDTLKEASGEFAALSEELSRLLDRCNQDFDQTSAEARKSLDLLVLRSREAASGIAKSAREMIDNAVQVVSSAGIDVDSRTQDSASSIMTTSEELVAQLDQVASVNASFLEGMKRALSTHLERTDSILNQAFVALSDLLSVMQDQFESQTSENRMGVLKLMQAQVSASRDRTDGAASSLTAGLDKWATDSGRSVQRRLAQASKEVGGTLDAEAEKFASTAGELSNKLSSSFGSVLATTIEGNKLVMTGAKKMFREFETGVGSKLTEITSDLTSAAGTHIQESTAFYRGLRSILDSRLEQNVSSLASYAEKMQKDIDSAIEDQMARIEKHTEAIRNELRARLDEAAKKYAGLTESLGSSFGGLLSSQSLETRDLIGSAHTQFRNAVKTEIASLQEDSAKLRKEYSSEIDARVDKATASYDTMKKSLEDLVTQRKSSLSRSVAEMLSRIEGTINSIEGGMTGIESGTIQELGAELARASGDFSTSVGTARDTLGSRIGSAADSSAESLAKASSGLKSTVDSYASEEKDAQQRLLADVGKKLDTLSSKATKEFLQRTESLKAEVAAGREESAKAQTASNDETIGVLESQMSEGERAFGEMSEFTRSTFLQASTAVATLGRNLSTELAQMQQGLARAAEDAETSLLQRSEVGVKQFEEAALGVLKKAASRFKGQTDAFGAACSISLDKSTGIISGLPSSILEKVSSSMNQITAGIDGSNSELFNGLSEEFSGLEASSKSATDEFSREMDRFKGALTKVAGSFSEKTKQSVTTGTQRASKKLESAGMSVKTQLASSSSRLMENLRNDVAARSAEINRATEQLRGQVSESMSGAKQTRAEGLARLDSEVDNALEQWSGEQRAINREIRQRAEQVIQGLESVVSKTVKTMDTVRTASDVLTRARPETTWYLTGNDEVLAHTMDMAQRAQKSIVIATVTVRGLDVKRLSKVAESVRRVLIIPESEEQQPVVQEIIGLGWRVWKTSSPMTMAIMDDKEILIGGVTETPHPVVLVSNDKTYLRLFHDILGPSLTIRPRPSSQPERTPSVVQPD